MRVSADGFAWRLLAALALVPIAGCGGSSGGGGGGGGGSGGGSAGPAACEGPQASGNLVSCSGGWDHRAAASACALPPPSTEACTIGEGSCTTDADCVARPNGRCGEGEAGGLPYCECTYSCATDAECGVNEICVCGSGTGRCVAATCKTDADCGQGLLCASIVDGEGECGHTVYHCQSAADTCMTDADCEATSNTCVYASDHRECGSQEPCGIGRPFLVDGRERLSPLAARADWLARDLHPRTGDLDLATREALSARWAAMGSMEHASVAAFARFVLQLLSLGAPAELVRDAQTAMADETRHAELCFAIASAYGGAPVGPGPLDMDRALAASDARSILVTAIHEGCVGETVAALEAAEMAARADDPVVRELLHGIAEDESRHAELAYRFVRWVVGARPELGPIARAAFAGALATRSLAPRGSDAVALSSHGFAGDGLRHEIRSLALDRVVRPCSEALFAHAA
jgi:hypothetical protein